MHADKVDKDIHGNEFVIAPDGSTTFGQITDKCGLKAAPIKLCEGIITNDETKEGYGLVHIEARHGDEIREAGYTSVEEFVQFVAENYDENDIKVGKKNKKGGTTYLLQVKKTHNYTLSIELSSDETYWNINSGGVFNARYGEKRESVKPASAQQDGESVLDNTLRPVTEADNKTRPNGNVSDTSSVDKDTENP